MSAVEPDEVHDIDPDAPLDLTGDEQVDSWRGVNVEDVDDGEGGLAGLLRESSRAQLSVPLLIKYGIDEGVPPLVPGGDGSIKPLMTAVIGVLIATVVGAF